MRLIVTAMLAFVPHLALAAGDGGDDPPKPTETTAECEAGMVWDEKTETCVEAEEQSLNDDQRYRAVRELAYAGRYTDAMKILATMTEGETARVMTYRGFLLRKTGQVEEGIAAYEEAIRLDPANLLARSYYGQLLVEMDEIQLAQAQLDEIRLHGGTGTWSERSLAMAIETGVTYNF
ncbi:MAG TPA: tetratricopeptide repeat protein [Tabrizicola sp.]|nr:tetratricopeptide repeat protein [Tabrizicola sp.]